MILKILNKKILKLSEAALETIDRDLLNRLTFGSTSIDGKYMYLDRDKYKGKGRPKKSDYTESPTLYIDKKT